MSAAMERPGAVTPHLVVSDASAAIKFYQNAFGAKELTRMVAPDGRRLMHAAVRVNGMMVMLCDDFPEHHGGKSRLPAKDVLPSVTIHLDVPDAEPIFARAVAAGATVTMNLADQFWGDRYGRLLDPFGHEWSVGSPSPAAMVG